LAIVDVGMARGTSSNPSALGGWEQYAIVGMSVNLFAVLRHSARHLRVFRIPMASLRLQRRDAADRQLALARQRHDVPHRVDALRVLPEVRDHPGGFLNARAEMHDDGVGVQRDASDIVFEIANVEERGSVVSGRRGCAEDGEELLDCAVEVKVVGCGEDGRGVVRCSAIE